MNEAEIELIGKFRGILKEKGMKIPVEPGTSLLNLLEYLGRKTGVDLLSRFISPNGKPMEEASLIINREAVDLDRIEDYGVNPGDRVVLSPSVAGGG